MKAYSDMFISWLMFILVGVMLWSLIRAFMKHDTLDLKAFATAAGMLMSCVGYFAIG
jgi:uncharacterized membrane protein YdjX (TVP38/TMEM64 family)